MSHNLRRYALFSLYTKEGGEVLAKALQDKGITILASGGTAKYLREHGIDVVDVADYTGFEQSPDHLVVTLHPKLHFGILCDRDKQEHIDYINDQNKANLDAKHPMGVIDWVVVNFYPFKQKLEEEFRTRKVAKRYSDIGGPSMASAAAKNSDFVGVVNDPDDYEPIADQLDKNGQVDQETRDDLRQKVYNKIAEYFQQIADFWKSFL